MKNKTTKFEASKTKELKRKIQDHGAKSFGQDFCGKDTQTCLKSDPIDSKQFLEWVSGV